MRARLLITGGSGFLGRALRERAAGWEVHATSRRGAPLAGATAHALDLARPERVEPLLAAVAPALVLHAAATMREPDLEAIVERGTAAVARACERLELPLLHVSTDMVFDGEHAPYAEDAAPSPITPYGHAKAAAEASVLAAGIPALVARVSLLYSLRAPDPRLVRDRETLARGGSVAYFTDERRSATEVDDLAEALLRAAGELRRRPLPEALPRLVHLAAAQSVSRWELGRALLRHHGVPADGVRAATVAASGLVRPRDLTLAAPRTPARWREPLRTLWSALDASGDRESAGGSGGAP